MRFFLRFLVDNLYRFFDTFPGPNDTLKHSLSKVICKRFGAVFSVEKITYAAKLDVLVLLHCTRRARKTVIFRGVIA